MTDGPTSGTPPAGGKAKAVKVLIADDDPDLRFVMQRLLEDAGFIVATAQDGAECLAKAASFAPDLIVLDIMMPGMHGLEVLKRLKAAPATARIGVIICTARGFKVDHDQAREQGALAVLSKPMRNREFVDLVRRHTGLEAAAGQAAPAGAARAAQAYVPRLRDGQAAVKMWGTRGSVPVSGQRYVRHGGNTSCVSVEWGDDLVVLDAGTGIRELGDILAALPPRRIHLFVTHTHWDHIQGFPFFIPAYIPGFRMSIYGAAGFGKDLGSVFKGQLDKDYFPVEISDMKASIDIRHLPHEPVRVGEMTVSWEYTHHPGAAVAYKVEVAGRRLVYLSDNEFLRGYMGPPEEVGTGHELLVPYRQIIDFLTGTDLLLAEAQYLNEEYRNKVDWGHSSLSNACLLAKLARVPRWIATHHDPRHSDQELHSKLILTRQVLTSLGHPAEVSHAFDGMVEYF
ncbi:MAG: response regulator [Elusimicrobia bacterium]|nr:response regulator [Elusimicrobiota bacterium]